MEKEKTIQEEAHEALHAIFANDRKQMFPFVNYPPPTLSGLRRGLVSSEET